MKRLDEQDLAMVGAFRDATRPPARLAPADWVNGRVVIQDGLTPRYDTSLAPWMRDPLNCLADPEAREVCVLAPIGTGKTAMLEAAMVYVVAQDPGPTLIVGQVDDTVDEWMETRMDYAFNNTEETRILLPSNRHKKRKSAIIWPHMNLFATGANKSGLQEKSRRRVFGDEVWQWKKGMMQYARGRLHNRWNRQIFFMAQAGDEGSDWHEAWMNTDRREFCFACPKCGFRQPMNFRTNIVMDKPPEGERWDLLARAKTARIVCNNPEPCDWTCGDDTRTRRELAENAEYVAQAAGLPGHVGFHYSKFFRWSVPLWELCLAWLKSEAAWEQGDSEPRKQFVNQELAEFWKNVQFENAGVLVGDGYLKQEHAEGQPIDDEAYRFLTNDVQRDHFWTVCRAWRSDGSSRLLWEGRTLTWEEIERLRVQYKVKDTMVFVDAGYRTDEVYWQCAERNWTALHGSGVQTFRHRLKSGKSVDRAYGPFMQADTSTGRKARYAHFSNERCKDILATLRNGQGVAWHKPDDVSEHWLSHMNSEEKREIVNTKTRQSEWRWIRVKRSNHLWDCETMQVVAACMLRLIGQED